MHEPPLRRRSPRLFPSPPNSHHLALTLHDNSRSDPVLESLHKYPHYTPQPLKVHHPRTSKLLLLKSPSSSPVRRSPRFNGVVQSGNGSGSASTLSKSNGKTVRSSESRKLELSLSSDSVVNGGKRKREVVDREFVRRSPRFSGLKSEMSVEIDVKLGKKTPLKLIESPRLLLLQGNLGEIEEDKVLRRSPRFSASNSEEVIEIGGKLGKKAALKLVKSVECKLSDKNLGVKSPSSLMAEKLGKIKEDQVMRRSPRFSGSKPETIVEIEVNLGKKAPLKLIKSAECEESEAELGMESPIIVSPENLGKMEEDRVLRRSPRGLPSSLAVDDECDEFEFGFSLKKAKKKKNKAPKEEPKASKVNVKVCGRREDCFFVGEPVSEEEALQKWGWRYQLKRYGGE